MSNFPFYEVAEVARLAILGGATIHQKFTCAGCGAPQIMPVANKFFTRGSCEECSFVTDIEAVGCNFVMISRCEKDRPN